MPIPDFSQRTIIELMSLKDRVAVVTGAAQGIGYAIAERLAESGAHVIVADVDKAAVSEVAARLAHTYQRRVIGVDLDVCDEAAVSAVAGRAVAELGELGIWVNNAGIYPITPVLDVTATQYAAVVDVNLKGTFLGAREAAKRMVVAGGGGVIVNMSSVGAYRASPVGGAEYVAAKHGVDGLTRALGVQLGKYGIRVLGVAPTTITTPGLKRSRDEVSAAGLDAVDASQVKPLGRDGVPDDVARVVLFCASDLSTLMTGSTLLVDGGILAVL